MAAMAAWPSVAKNTFLAAVPQAATEVMRGLLAGLYGFATFFLVIAGTIATLGVAGSFVLAAAVILAVQGTSFALLRRTSP